MRLGIGKRLLQTVEQLTAAGSIEVENGHA